MFLVYSLICTILISVCHLPMIKIYQLENYKIKNYLKKVLKFNFAIGDKNKLNFTKRIKRLIFINFFVFFAIFLLIFYFLPQIYICFPLSFVGILFSPILLVLSLIICMPIEYFIKCTYISKAKKKLQSLTCKKIAITGSFGKTSTKQILLQILSQKFKVCATPKSYNTPMGVCKTILENLDETHDFFIVEMGARHPKDIEFLCKMVGADYGVLTPVGNCHIETFKSLQNVENTKFEICENVKDLMIINGSSPSNLKLFDRCKKVKFLVCQSNSFAYAENIEINNLKTSFTLIIDGQKINVESNLLGRANIDNVVVASALAYLLGVDLLNIKNAIGGLKPTPHRMELIKGFATVIDDSYNSNMQGFKQAVDVLASFPGRKILVSPGIVELGCKQELINSEVGAYAGKVCDIFIIMNKTNRKALLDGAIHSKMKKENIYFAENRAEQKKLLKEIVKKGDVILFENDLPDNYG